VIEKPQVATKQPKRPATNDGSRMTVIVGLGRGLGAAARAARDVEIVESFHVDFSAHCIA
jgi:hypothetical protein